MSCRILSTNVLNGAERYFCADGGWTTIGYAAHLTGNRAILIGNAPAVIECLLKRHARMRTRLRVEGNRYLVDTLEYDREYLSMNLFFSTIDSSQDSWQEIVERRCNQDPYTINGTLIFPLFHFVLLVNSQLSESDDRFHLLLFANHCVADGRSGFILINDFLTLATSSNITTMVEPLNNEIFPLIVDLIPRPFGFLYPALSVVAQCFFKRELRKLTQPRIPIKPSPLPDDQFHPPRYYIKFLFASSSTNLYMNLHQQCRSHQVTLNGPLLGCLLLAIHYCFPSKNPKRLKPFSMGMAFDMRSRLPRSPLTKTSVGFFVGFGEMKFRRSLAMRSTRFWFFAQRCMENTRQQLTRTGIPLIMHILADVFGDAQKFVSFAPHIPDGRVSELALSNIGKYPSSCTYNQDEIGLHGIHVINNASVYRTSTMMYVTCAGDRQLDFSLAHEMESDDRAKQFLDFYIHLMEICADDQRCRAETTLDDILKMIQS